MLTLEPKYRDAFKLRDELAARGIDEASTDEVIAENACEWFLHLTDRERALLIATMRELALAKIQLQKGAAEFRARFLANRAAKN